MGQGRGAGPGAPPRAEPHPLLSPPPTAAPPSLPRPPPPRPRVRRLRVGLSLRRSRPRRPVQTRCLRRGGGGICPSATRARGEAQSVRRRQSEHHPCPQGIAGLRQVCCPPRSPLPSYAIHSPSHPPPPQYRAREREALALAGRQAAAARRALQRGGGEGARADSPGPGARGSGGRSQSPGPARGFGGGGGPADASTAATAGSPSPRPSSLRPKSPHPPSPPAGATRFKRREGDPGTGSFGRARLGVLIDPARWGRGDASAAPSNIPVRIEGAGGPGSRLVAVVPSKGGRGGSGSGVCEHDNDDHVDDDDDVYDEGDNDSG